MCKCTDFEAVPSFKPVSLHQKDIRERVAAEFAIPARVVRTLGPVIFNVLVDAVITFGAIFLILVLAVR
jgi:hypothetical protein